ncbi:autotransporter assembly complex protein TamA [Roseateles sp. DB2]|uniref:autotransporter assembly complex protein TamA n=1 Tax=Roseateles sp. DB2 TaxID=3453717 RepID=UPI003EEB99EE
MRVVLRAIAALGLSLLLSACSTLGSLPEVLGGKPRPAAAATTRLKAAYRLDIRASGEVQELLSRHLDLARFQQIAESDSLSPVELDRLAAVAPEQARSLLETLGYFDAHVEVQRQVNADRTQQDLTLIVDPGPRSVVGDLDLQFEGEIDAEAGRPDAPRSLALQAELRQLWPLQKGRAFTQAAWSSAKSTVLARARAQGYPLARWASTDAEVDTEARQVNLRLHLDSGPLFRLGSLQIEGLQHQSEDSVRRLAGYATGEPYTEQALLDFQERLLRTQLFDGVSVDIQPEAAQAAAVPVRVRVKEAPRQQATTGIGYSAMNGYNASVEHLHRLPAGLPLRARSKVQLGQLLRTAEFELSSHPQPDMQRNLGSLQWEQDLNNDKNIRTLSARVGRLREAGHDERLVFAEMLRSIEADDEGASLRSGAWSGNVQWTRRRLDSLLLPTSGYTAQLLLGAGRADNNAPRQDSGAFGRVRLKIEYFKPLPSGWYLSARTDLAQIIACDKVGLPAKMLYLAGGDDSVRGYAYQSLGIDKDDGSPLSGGRKLWTGSLEVARPVMDSLPMLWGAAFIDAGNVSDRWQSLRPVVGYGVGARLRSPVGALRLDLARAHETGKWRLHFSVGIAL